MKLFERDLLCCLASKTAPMSIANLAGRLEPLECQDLHGSQPINILTPFLV